MRNIVLSTLLVSTILVTGLSAAEMTTDTMMKKDTMMMKDSTMMHSKMTVSQIAKMHGYNWIRDRKALAKKTGITNYRGTVVQNIKIKNYLLSMKMDGSMMKDDMMMKKESAMMDKKVTMMTDDAMMKKDTMMMKESGMYKVYSESAVSADLAAGKSVYLFFHATWCPGCKALDSAISADTKAIPANTVIYKVDYDTMTVLRQKYGVTMQHTLVKLNADGTMMKKISGPKSVADIVQ